MNNPRDQFHSAFLLHRRDYRETSVIADFFTADQGVVGAVVKGVRGSKSVRVVLQPFMCLNVSWVGQGELKTVKTVESTGAALALTGTALFCGLYINELLLRLLHRFDPYPALFDAYQQTLLRLSHAAPDETDVALRLFEKQLLSVLGYGFNFLQDSEGADIDETTHYVFESERGFMPLAQGVVPHRNTVTCKGDTLKAMACDDYALPHTRQTAKKLMRVALSYYLGDKPLNSRQLFGQIKKDGVQ